MKNFSIKSYLGQIAFLLFAFLPLVEPYDVLFYTVAAIGVAMFLWLFIKWIVNANNGKIRVVEGTLFAPICDVVIAIAGIVIA